MNTLYISFLFTLIISLPLLSQTSPQQLITEAVENCHDSAYIAETFSVVMQNDTTLTVEKISSALQQMEGKSIVHQLKKHSKLVYEVKAPARILFYLNALKSDTSEQKGSIRLARFQFYEMKLIRETEAPVTNWPYRVHAFSKPAKGHYYGIAAASLYVNGPRYTELFVVKHGEEISDTLFRVERGMVTAPDTSFTLPLPDDFYAYKTISRTDSSIVIGTEDFEPVMLSDIYLFITWDRKREKVLFQYSVNSDK